MTVAWRTASGIILHHQSIASELSIYCSSLIYFPVAIAIITTRYQKHYFYYCYLLLPLSPLSYYFATKHFAADINFAGVVELTTQLLILENILWLPLCRINKFGLNTLPSKTIAIPYTCGLSRLFSGTIAGEHSSILWVTWDLYLLVTMRNLKDEKTKIYPSTTRGGKELPSSSALDSPSVLSKLATPKPAFAIHSDMSHVTDDATSALHDTYDETTYLYLIILCH